MLCPNEAGCSFSRYLIPKTNGEEDVYENFRGTFVAGDLCNFKVTNPVGSDFNDVMYIRLEYALRCGAILVKGESLANPIALYNMAIGQNYTGLKGINFYVLFSATEESSGDFVFRLWYKSASGGGEITPTTVTWDEGKCDKNDCEEVEPEVILQQCPLPSEQKEFLS